MVSENIAIRRLAFIKYLFTVALTQSNQPEPLNALALLTFHDSIELFLQLVADSKDIPSKNFGFVQYFKNIPGLKNEIAASKLNDARVALKHHGNLPSRFDMNIFRSETVRFFEDNTPAFFEIAFADISLASLASDAEVRSKLIDAETSMNAHMFSQALVDIAKAFWRVTNMYEQWELGKFGRSMFAFREPLYSPQPLPEHGDTMAVENYQQLLDSQGDALTLQLQSELYAFSSETRDRLLSLEDMLRALAMGIDTRRYVRFRLLTSEYLDVVKLESLPGTIPSQGTCQFCFAFVIECALQMQELVSEDISQG